MVPVDPNKQHLYQRYAQAYDSGTLDQIEPREAAELLQQFMQDAPAGLQQQVYQKYFSQMSPQRRQALAHVLAQRLPPQYAVTSSDPQQMAQGVVQLAQQRPDLLLEVCGLGSSPVVNAAVVELTALVAKDLLTPLTSSTVPLVRDVAVPVLRDVAVPVVRDVVSLLR